MHRRSWLFCVLLAVMWPAGWCAAAEDVAAFYKGKTITITAAGGAGGGYAVYALLLAEHLGKYLPGHPNVIVNYNPAASGLAAVEYTYSVAPQDGTAILAPLQSMPTLQVLGVAGIRFDAAKLQWIGRAAETTSGLVVRRSVASSIDDLMARKDDLAIGITHPGAPNHILPALLRYCLDLNMKLVSGYPGSAPMALAFSRAEVDGLALPLDSLRTVYPNLLQEALVAQSGLKRAAELGRVPLATELCKTPERRSIAEFFQVQEEMGRSYAVGPGVPAERVAALRDAFDAAMRNPELLAAARSRTLAINPMAGAELQGLVQRHVGTQPAIVARAKAAVGLQ